MIIDTSPIAFMIEDQFPEFYRSQGPNFIAFVEAYYEWMHQSGQILDVGRKLPSYVDIDSTTDQFLVHFRESYMNQLPIELIGNQQLFQKHILELYRSKGSIAGLKLLFRLLYNSDIEVYVPSYDIFKGSDGEWISPKYLEVSDSPKFGTYHGQIITGVSSGATAMVESAEIKVVEDGSYNVLYLSNIQGSFSKGEQLVSNGILYTEASIVVGSPTSIEINTSSAGFKVGDVLIDQRMERSESIKAVVREVYNSTGIIDFDIVDGGSYYSLDAQVTITSGSNTTGIGADFEVFGIGDTQNFAYSTDLIAPYANTMINAMAYGFPFNPAANQSTVIDQAIAMTTILVGQIERISILNPGTGYDGSVTVSVTDPYTVTRGIWDGNGFGGNNAIITGTSLTGIGLVKSAEVYDSGIRNSQHLSQITMTQQANNELTTSITYITAAIGISPGYYDDTKGFTSDDKYLTDGHYYQDYSYVIKSTHQLEDYIEILRKTVHVAGNLAFGQVVLRGSTTPQLNEITSTLIQV